jgi:hypothetical protein
MNGIVGEAAALSAVKQSKSTKPRLYTKAEWKGKGTEIERLYRTGKLENLQKTLQEIGFCVT